MKLKVKPLLRKYNISLKKGWSQCFLVSKPVIAAAASYAKGVVLEIGPGLGFITAELAKRADKVIAVEKDRVFVNLLRTEYDFDNVEIIQEDITEIELPACDQVISNIPYHLSSVITFKVLKKYVPEAVLFYQKEFAQRMAEMPPSPRSSRLSVMVALQAEASIIQYVSKTCFYPVPQTESALVHLGSHSAPVDKFLEVIIKGLYTHKNKIVKNALLSSVDITGLSEHSLGHQCVPFAERRVWSLTLDELRSLAQVLQDEDFLCSASNTSQ